MSRETLDVLLQFGPFAVLLVAAGAIVAAIIGAANAWAVAWFNARASRQVAIDAAHREYRKEWCADLVQQAQLLDGLALYITEVFGESLDAGIPCPREDALRVTTYARGHLAKVTDPEFRRPSPPDDLFNSAYRYAAKAERRLRSALREAEAAIAGDPLPDLSSHRRELVTAAAGVARATTLLQLAVECFVFNLGAANRRRLKRLLTDTRR
jgi:hypothetical protein